MLAAETVPQLALEPTDRHQVLRCTWVLVRPRGEWCSRREVVVGQANDIVGRAQSAAFAPHHSGPG